MSEFFSPILEGLKPLLKFFLPILSTILLFKTWLRWKRHFSRCIGLKGGR